jgi:outer membrane protein assembly factor BamB
MIREELFSCEAALFLVFRRDDGSISWSDYRNQKVKVALPLADGTRCIILLDPYLKDGVFKNLFCIEPDGTVVWTAELPERPFDSFLSAKLGEEGLVAYAESGYSIAMSPETGEVIRTYFVK